MRIRVVNDSYLTTDDTDQSHGYVHQILQSDLIGDSIALYEPASPGADPDNVLRPIDHSLLVCKYTYFSVARDLLLDSSRSRAVLLASVAECYLPFRQSCDRWREDVRCKPTDNRIERAGRLRSEQTANTPHDRDDVAVSADRRRCASPCNSALDSDKR